MEIYVITNGDFYMYVGCMPNNVDLIYNLKLKKEYVDLAVVSDRGYDKLRFYKINKNCSSFDNNCLEEITAPNQQFIFSTSQDEVNTEKTSYGLAVSQPIIKNKYAVAFTSQNDTTCIAKLVIYGNRKGEIEYKVVNKFNLPENFILENGENWSPFHDDDNELSHAEGMVIDDKNNSLYIAQEQVGIWKTSITNSKSNLQLIDTVNEYGIPYKRIWNNYEGEYNCEMLWNEDQNYGSDYLSEDVEGLTIYNSGNGEGYLIASSQGSNSFIVYDRKSNDYITDFKIGDNDDIIDGSQECDGAHVVNFNLGVEFPNGLFVVQDGQNQTTYINENGEYRISTNFKFVDWKDIANTTGLSINSK